MIRKIYNIKPLKFLLILVAYIVYSTSTAFAQDRLLSLAQISKVEFNKHQPFTSAISKPLNNLKSKGKIAIKTLNKTIVLKDEGEFAEYQHIGTLKGTSLIVICKLEPNSEEYYLINTRNARIDTLLSKPDLHQGNLLSYRRNDSDIPQEIQIAQVHDNSLRSNSHYSIKSTVTINEVYWLDRNTLYISTVNNLFYKATLPKQNPKLLP